MDGPMEILAVTASRYGNVEPSDEDAVVDFLEKNSEKIPDAEAEEIVVALLQRDQPAAESLAEAGVHHLPEFKYPNLDDARREARLYEQLQQVAMERERGPGGYLDAQRLYLTSTLLGRLALMVGLLLLALLVPGGLTATSSLARMAQTGLAVMAVLTALSAMDKFSLYVVERRALRGRARLRTQRPGSAPERASAKQAR